MKKFSDKTKNQWEDRKKFVKVPGKYELVDIQVATNDEDDEDEVDEGPAPKKKKVGDLVIMESELDKKVQDLIEMICDKKLMEETLKALKFDVDKAYLDQYQVQEAGGKAHLEYWIPAEEMDAFNQAIVGQIEVTQRFPD